MLRTAGLPGDAVPTEDTGEAGEAAGGGGGGGGAVAVVDDEGGGGGGGARVREANGLLTSAAFPSACRIGFASAPPPPSPPASPPSDAVPGTAAIAFKLARRWVRSFRSLSSFCRASSSIRNCSAALAASCSSRKASAAASCCRRSASASCSSPVEQPQLLLLHVLLPPMHRLLSFLHLV